MTGLISAAHRLQQDFAGAFGRVVGVDMRVGAVAGHDCRVIDDRIVEVGVMSERDGDRRLGSIAAMRRNSSPSPSSGFR